MKITKQKIKRLIKESLAEIYEKGEFVPDLQSMERQYMGTAYDKSDQYYGSRSQSYQLSNIQKVLQLICPTTKENQENARSGIELYNSFRKTDLVAHRVVEFANDFTELKIRGSSNDLLSFYRDFQGMANSGKLNMTIRIGSLADVGYYGSDSPHNKLSMDEYESNQYDREVRIKDINTDISESERMRLKEIGLSCFSSAARMVADNY